ncbi:Acg family FMN-binding oxidoreductase [Amycolatopsis keratiniphila]|uniref:Acg family FMN-binding oxidoreductase n=1 Tax=Amycolatopsis keratiniphila TaxID=129921 RepID=UPI00087BC452|nr:nitroreductase family protein [Amycolatopsis keratiniphila]OLZ49936.1 nitroreductase [Amycolatopsis keratiniphila subsp. nogabecina]SDU26198.1 Nitroreductase family protein [Amycolatopsis keratiniphila]
MANGWTKAETEVLARTLLLAPSVHDIQPWRLEFDGDRLLLRERHDLELPEHDPRGRDRLISCGAALANVELAVRVLGYDLATRMFPEADESDVVAAVETTGRTAPSDVDLHRYSAIARRGSYRHPFSGRRISREKIGDLIATAAESGVEARLIHDELELAHIADLLEFAAEVYRHDLAYQRELALWTIRDERSHRYGVGLPAGSLPWAGLVRQVTAIPDHRVLQRRLEEETLFVFLTVDDGRYDHLHAGHALQNTWLDAVDGGLAGAVLTQPLHLPEVRCGLTEALELPGFPQVLMRFGYRSGSG